MKIKNKKRTENAIHTATVASYNYDQDNKNWVRVDGGASRVIIFHNPQTQTYRVIGISAEKKVKKKEKKTFRKTKKNQSILSILLFSKD